MALGVMFVFVTIRDQNLHVVICIVANAVDGGLCCVPLRAFLEQFANANLCKPQVGL